MGLFKRNPFGHILFIKKWLIRIFGAITHKRYRGFNDLYIDGSEIIKNLPDTNATAIILEELLERLEKHYGKKPIIYATQKSYDLYIKDKYEEYPIWIRSVLKKPILSDGREWTLWQYSNRERLEGYKGEEKYIDINVFNGPLKEFSSLTQ